MNKQLSLMSLFEVGAHRGSRKSRLNPKLKGRVYGVSNGLCMINLVETKSALDAAAELLYKLGQKRKQVLIVGTSKHVQQFVSEYSTKFQNGDMPYVDNRWLGGTLSNWSTIKKTLKTLEKLQNIESNKEFFTKLARNEQLNINRQITKIKRFFAGLVNLKTNKPGAIIVLDSFNNPIAIKEAGVMGIPVIAFSNTNSLVLPENLKYTVVFNNNSINAITLVADFLSESYNEGLAAGVPVQTEVKEEGTKVVSV